MVTWNLDQAGSIVGSVSSAMFVTKGMCRVLGVIATLQADVGHGDQTVKNSCSSSRQNWAFLTEYIYIITQQTGRQPHAVRCQAKGCLKKQMQTVYICQSDPKQLLTSAPSYRGLPANKDLRCK